ncbi:unnamed protein product, partial [Heterosigma akashiwo]
YRFALPGHQGGVGGALFSRLPRSQVLTARPDVPEAWDVQAARAAHDLDN